MFEPNDGMSCWESYKIPPYEQAYMDFASFSLSLIMGFALTRMITEKIKFHLRFKGLWIHHWILALIAMVALIYLQVDHPLLWGGLTGVSLEGLARKNWSIIDRTSS
jgi:hypothetical protein